MGRFAAVRKGVMTAAAFAYAGYKWLEDHTDEVEGWSDKAIEQSKGKKVEPVVVTVANAAKAAVSLVRENGTTSQKK